MRILELYSGTKAISKSFASHDWETLTIDNNPNLKPDICIDMLDFDISILPKEWHHPDVIWASPPCTTFSVCTIARHWHNGKCNSSRGFTGLALVMKAIEIIRQLRPKFYFIENPRGMLRNQWFMLDFPRHSVTYCQYGEKYQKPTDIWTNANFQAKRCKAGARCHEYQPRNYKAKIGFPVQGLGCQGLSGAEERGKIPLKLCEEVYQSCIREPIQRRL